MAKPLPRIKSFLSLLETRLQALVEGSLARLFNSNRLQDELNERLMQVMMADVKAQPDGQLIAPNLFTIYIDPSLITKINTDTLLPDELATYIEKAGSQSGFQFLSPPVVRIFEEINTTAPLQVKAQYSLENIVETNAMIPESNQGQMELPTNAYLIIDGTRLFSLEKTVINIGRRSDNHLIIDDARISRVHSQLRVINGRFWIFDLDSLGGTFLNNQPIKQAVLTSGDVISLAGVPLVYAQDFDDLGETQRINFHHDGEE